MFIDAYLASLGTSQSRSEARMWSLTRIDDPETDEVTENKHNINNNNNNNNNSSTDKTRQRQACVNQTSKNARFYALNICIFNAAKYLKNATKIFKKCDKNI